VIDPRVIRNFVESRRDSHNWIKRLSDRELDDMLAEQLPANWKLPELMRHQKACLLLGMAYPGFAFFLDMGTGKTLVSIELLRYWSWRSNLQRLLVCVPTEPVVWSWQEQIEQFAHGLNYRLLLGSSAAKWDSLAALQRGLAIVTYPGLIHMVSAKAKKGRGPGNRLRPYLSEVERLCQNLGGLVLDESTFVGNEDSLFYRVCNQIAKRVPIRYALAGRPFGRHPLSLWTQMHLVDGGETFGANSGLFRQAFFTQKQSSWAYSRLEWKFDPTFKDELAKMIRHRSIFYDSDECFTLPKLVRITRRIGFADEMGSYYERLLHDALASRGQPSEIKNIFLRMRQISSGFMGYRDDETGEKSEIEFADNPKLDELMALIDDMPDGRKAVVFHEFTWSGRRICRELQARGIEHGWLWSGTADYPALKRRFDERPEFRVLVVNHKKGGYGSNLQAANYVFYFESPVSVIDRDQSEKRCYRKGQTRTTFLYDLVVRGTVDEKILLYQQQGRDLFRALMADPESVLGSQKSKPRAKSK
jgi:SNF2 family DNA or RNA helicase